MNEPKIRVAVVYGGRGSEHAISCVSAGSVLKHLDKGRFEVLPVGITRDGAWVLSSADPRAFEVQNRQLPAVDNKGAALALLGDPTRRALIQLEPGKGGEVLSGVDVVFPVLHGPFGEDGTIQGLLEMAEMPYVGSGVLSSAVGMDKEFARKLLKAEGLPVGEMVVLRSGKDFPQAERKRLSLPVFVKPTRSGSSIGVSKVANWDDLDKAISIARQYDPKVLVEAAVPGREIECGVLEFPDGQIAASLPAEIRILGNQDVQPEFYDFDAKYLDDLCEFDIPAKLDDTLTEQVRSIAVDAFRALDCQGFARVDFFVDEQQRKITINEVNTIPGFTHISMFPQMWAVTGVDYKSLLSILIDTALSRGTGLR
ncbi:MAG: D-alanine--D-alanine ligase family protein [Candidatus Binatia bacterium]